MSVILSTECLKLAERQAVEAGYADLASYLEYLIDKQLQESKTEHERWRRPTSLPSCNG